MPPSPVPDWLQIAEAAGQALAGLTVFGAVVTFIYQWFQGRDERGERAKQAKVDRERYEAKLAAFRQAEDDRLAAQARKVIPSIIPASFVTPGAKPKRVERPHRQWEQRRHIGSYDVDPMTPIRHPHDEGVWLGDVATLRALPPGVDAVVSLCRVTDGDLPIGVEQIDVRLIDIEGPDANPNLDFVLTDTVRLIELLRNEGRTVLLHCVAAQSRTPTVAALYGAHKQGISGKTALREVTSVLPGAWPNPDFQEAIQRLAP